MTPVLLKIPVQIVSLHSKWTARPGKLPLPSLQSRGGLDDGIPVKIVLDIIRRQPAHLEVCRRYHVLLVHCRMMSWQEEDIKNCS